MIQTIKAHYDDLHATVELASFSIPGGRSEHHAMLHVAPSAGTFAQQAASIREAERRLLATDSMQGCRVVFKRLFLSDIANQAPLLGGDAGTAVSLIQQPPLDGSKIASWLYIEQTDNVTLDGDSAIVSSNGYEHVWTMGMQQDSGNSFTQTAELLNDYSLMLGRKEMTIAHNCIRTWFFVRDVDTQYQGLVNARRAFFMANGLTEQTHYVASTGIGGVPGQQKSIVRLDAYAVKGLMPEQQRYLHAPSHLNATSEYGVTFERGTMMQYGDRSHVFISGTASIDNKGDVMYPGDVVRQTQRMWENVEALLREGNASFSDVAQIIVYIRDIADYATVRQLFDERFPATPVVITNASVCRPQWLVEMECMAITDKGNETFRAY